MNKRHNARGLRRFWTMGVGAMLLTLAPLVPVQAAGATSLHAGNCQPVTLSVKLGASLPADQTVSGTLCTPLYWHNGQKRIDVLEHGATYNRSYWDFPYDNAQYSYVNDTLLAGRATFAFDDIGTGQSSYPNSSDLTFVADAFVLHQIISWVHGHGYQKVDVVAHSKGSAVAIEEAGMYPHDISALVITGLLHQISTFGNTAAQGDFYPANQDPAFAGKNLENGQPLDDGYFTTRPGTRAQAFYSAFADPGVIAADEATKDVFVFNDFAQALGLLFAPPAGNISNSITVPILTAEGQQDALFCGAGGVDCSSTASVRAEEAPYYQHAASYTVQVVPLTGHDLTLHPTSLLSFAGINAWIDQQSALGF